MSYSPEKDNALGTYGLQGGSLLPTFCALGMKTLRVHIVVYVVQLVLCKALGIGRNEKGKKA